MRVGLLGGSFNPIHNGHLLLAEAALKQLHLDKVIFIPAYIPPHKNPAELIGAEERYRMTEMAISRRPDFKVTRYEIDRKKTSYSIETIRYFRGSYSKGSEFFFIIGSDSLEELDTWKDKDRLIRLCRFVAAERPGYKIGPRYAGIEKLDMSAVDISSSKIRSLIREGKSITGLVPTSVEEYIIEKGLYK